MRNAIHVDTKDIKKLLAEHFNVPEENVIKAQYSYTVITEDEDAEAPSFNGEDK